MDLGKEPLILFDVDGTLTESGCTIAEPMISALAGLARYAEIGFLSGSPLSSLKRQLWPALNNGIIKMNSHMLPCNGTEYLIPQGTDGEIDFLRIHQASMSLELGDRDFNDIMKALCMLQAEMVGEDYNIPFTGQFIQNRGSIVNWCPIGRGSDSVDRGVFVEADIAHSIREKYIKKIRKMFFDIGVEVVVKFGGDTSFDIFPPGWDKTYVSNHFGESTWDLWFVGDRCGENGNDYELFEQLSPAGKAFETSGPSETIEIIDYYILKELIVKDEQF